MNTAWMRHPNLLKVFACTYAPTGMEAKGLSRMSSRQWLVARIIMVTYTGAFVLMGARILHEWLH